MNIFFGIPFLFFGIWFLVLETNAISSNLITTSGNIFSREALFNNNNYYKSNPFNLFDKSHLSLDFYNIPLANAQEQKEEDDININNNNTKINESDKYVILIFDRGYKSAYTDAKPILDKYDFKSSIFVACERIESSKGMSWDQLRQLQNEGHDIQSHGLKHERLTEIQSDNKRERIISGGQECLQEQGFNPTIFQAPFNKGGDDPQILDTINKYFDLAFTGHSELMFLNCDGWENFGYDIKNYDGTTDCSPYFSDGTPTPTNKLGMKEWSHDREHYDVNKEMEDYDPHGKEVSSILFEKFVEVVNSQTEFNKQGEINAIPIIGYHEIATDDEIDTSPELFELEMEYLYDNGFKVITLDDLGYNENQERFYIKNGDNIGGVVLSQFDNKAQER
jgi:hypothetical protein